MQTKAMRILWVSLILLSLGLAAQATNKINIVCSYSGDITKTFDTDPGITYTVDFTGSPSVTGDTEPTKTETKQDGYTEYKVSVSPWGDWPPDVHLTASSSLTYRVTSTNCECCSSSGSCAGAGSSTADNGCMDFRISLGHTPDGKKAGTAFLYEETPKSQGLSISDVKLTGLGSTLNIITNMTGRLGVRSAECFLDITSPASGSVLLRLYHHNQVEIGNTNYTIASGASPFAVYQIGTTYNASTGTQYVIHYTNSALQATDQFVYTFEQDPQTGSAWLLQRGLAKNSEKLRITTVGTERTETRWYYRDGFEVRKKAAIYRPTSTGVSRVSQVIETQGSTVQTNNYFYYTNGQPSLIQYAGGGWVRYEYQGGLSTNPGSIIRETRPWLDAGPDETQQVVTVDYGYLGVNDCQLDCSQITSKVRRICGVVVEDTRWSYISDATNGVIETETRLNVSVTSAAETQATFRIYEFNLDAIGFGRLKKVIYSDGRVDEYLVNDEPTGDVYRTETAIHYPGTNGAPAATTMEYAQKDIGGRTLLAQQKILVGTEWVVTRADIFEYDAMGHQTRVLQGDGLVAESQWDCCHKILDRDDQGWETSYQYDGDQLVKTIQAAVTNRGNTGNLAVPEKVTE